MNDDKIALVTGSSTGIGFETSLALARNGFYTYASMRDLDKSNKIADAAKSEGLPLRIIELDVNNEGSVYSAIDIISKEKNKLDVLVNNAGYGLFGSLEDLSIDEIRGLFDTNYFGIVRLIKNSLPLMRLGKGRRTIVNISSVGGRIGAPILSAYQSTKFAVEGLSESLYYELEPFGIKVVIVEPGFIKTNIMNSSIQAKGSLNPDSPYFQVTHKIAAYFRSMVNDNPSVTSPSEVATVILEAIKSDNPKLRYLVGQDANQILAAKNQLPETEFLQMIKKQFMEMSNNK